MYIYIYVIYLYLYTYILYILCEYNYCYYRNHWDPSLVRSETMLLEQRASFLSQVYVCTFCYQFFSLNIRERVISEGLTKVNIYLLYIIYLFIHMYIDIIYR